MLRLYYITHLKNCILNSFLNYESYVVSDLQFFTIFILVHHFHIQVLHFLTEQLHWLCMAFVRYFSCCTQLFKVRLIKCRCLHASWKWRIFHLSIPNSSHLLLKSIRFSESWVTIITSMNILYTLILFLWRFCWLHITHQCRTAALILNWIRMQNFLCKEWKMCHIQI